MSMTSADLHANHRILLEAPIRNGGVTITTNSGDKSWGVEDLVDLNGDGQAAYTGSSNRSGSRWNYQTTEPILAHRYKDGVEEAPYTRIKAYANESHQEIIGPEDFSQPGMPAASFETRYYSVHYMPGYAIHGQVRAVQDNTSYVPIQQWVDQLTTTLPDAVGARWAFDCNRNTFVVYK